MTINIVMHIYIGENAHWEIYAPPPLQSHYTIFFQFFYFLFHFRCILLQISHKKCFFISISILGRSGVKLWIDEGYILIILALVVILMISCHL